MAGFYNSLHLISSSFIGLFISSTSAFAQIAESWSIDGDVSITASNSSAAVLLEPQFGVMMESPSIGEGVKNSINASAVGASATASYSGVNFADSSTTATIDGAVSVMATNLDSPVTTRGSVTDGQITAGHENSISVSAVGVSAQLGVNDFVSGGSTFTRALDVNGEITVSAENSGAVTLQTDFDGPQISGGTRNTISGTAIGASAAVSVSAMVDDGAYEADIAIGSGNAINVTAINSGDVTLGSTDDPAQPASLTGATTTADSVDGTISLMAIGASGSVSSSTVVYSGSAIPSVAFGDVNFDVQNSGTVQANVEISDASLEGANSIATGAVGATASASTKLANYADNTFTSSGEIGIASYNSTNSGSVVVMGGMSNPTIVDGYNLSMSIAAVGSAISHSLTN